MTDTAHRDIFASRFRALAKRDGATKTKLRSWFETNRFDGLEDFLDRADATGFKIADAFLSGLESPGLHTEPERDHFKSESPIRAFTDWSVNGLYAIGKGFRPSLAHLPSYLNAMESKEGWRVVQILEAGSQTPSFLFRCIRQISDDELRARHPMLTVDLDGDAMVAPGSRVHMDIIRPTGDNSYAELAGQLELEAMDTLAEMQQAVLKVATGLRQVSGDLLNYIEARTWPTSRQKDMVERFVDRINGYAAELAPSSKPSRPEKEDSFGAIYGRDYLVIDEDGDTVPAFYEGDTWWLTPAEEGGAKVQTPRKIVSIKGPLLSERPSATGRKTLGEYIEAHKQGIVLNGFGQPAKPSLRFAESDQPKLDACPGTTDVLASMIGADQATIARAGDIDPDKEREANRIAERNGIRPKGGERVLAQALARNIDEIQDVMHDDPVNPKHYGGSGCAEIIENMPGNCAHAVTYLWRAGDKPDQPEVQEAEKALWFLNREAFLATEYEEGEGNLLPGQEAAMTWRIPTPKTKNKGDRPIPSRFYEFAQERIPEAMPLWRKSAITDIVRYVIGHDEDALKRATDTVVKRIVCLKNDDCPEFGRQQEP